MHPQVCYHPHLATPWERWGTRAFCGDKEGLFLTSHVVGFCCGEWKGDSISHWGFVGEYGAVVLKAD